MDANNQKSATHTKTNRTQTNDEDTTCWYVPPYWESWCNIEQSKYTSLAWTVYHGALGSENNESAEWVTVYTGNDNQPGKQWDWDTVTVCPVCQDESCSDNWILHLGYLVLITIKKREMQNKSNMFNVDGLRQENHSYLSFYHSSNQQITTRTQFTQ